MNKKCKDGWHLWRPRKIVDRVNWKVTIWKECVRNGCNAETERIVGSVEIQGNERA